MKVAVDFFRAKTMATLKTVREYHRSMEEQLHQLRKVEEDFLKNECKSWEEWDAGRDGLEWTFDQLFPRCLRYSFVVFLYSVVETELPALCGELRRRKSLPEENMNKNMSLEQCKTFLSNNCDIDFGRIPAFEKLTTLKKVRDCIAHAGGLVEKSRDKDFLMDFAAHDEGMTISAHTISQGLLAIEPRFCDETTNAAIEFFTFVFERGGSALIQQR